MSQGEGRKTWLIPDAYLPEIGSGKYQGHEAVCLLNTGSEPAQVWLDFYFEDRAPIKDVPVRLLAERTWHIRLDRPEQLGGVVIPREVPYAIRVRSNVNIVVQHSRLDVTQTNMALFTTMAWPAPEVML